MYLVVEIQTNGSTISTLNYQYDSLNLAEQKYYLILAAAAVSTLDVHAALIMDCRGVILKNSFYDRRNAEE